MSFDALLLAAGQSRRFGRNKLLQILPNQQVLIIQTLQHLLPAVDRIFVVLPAQQTRLKETLTTNAIQKLHYRYCSESIKGMGHSIAYGIKNLPDDSQACLIALADMPLIKTSTYQALRDHLHQSAPLVIPTYEGKRGNPIGFAEEFYPQLCNLEGDQGAKLLVQQQIQQGRVVYHHCDDAGIHQDIDTQDDWQRLITKS